MQTEKPKRDVLSGSRTLTYGLALIVPLLLLATMTHLIPFSNVISTSMTSYNIIGDSEPIGMENYERLLQDKRFADAIGNTIPYMLQRALIFAIVPLLMGGLIGLQARGGRLVNRALLSVLAVLIVPVVLSVIWQIYWSPNWGIEPSPIFNEDLSFMSPDSAPVLLQWLDMLLTITTAAVVGGTIFIAVMRGQQREMTGVVVGFIGVTVAGGSGALMFDLPFVLTQGGPGNSTATYMLEVYLAGFQQFRIGAASAQATVLGMGVLVVGLIIGVIVVASNLRVVQVSPAQQDDGNNLLSVASVPLILLAILLLGGYVVWALTFPSQSEQSLFELAPITQGLVNSLSPLFAIWFIQLPIAFMAGMGLGFYRPFGRIGSGILFIVLLAIMLIPTEVLIFEWFTMSRDLGVVNDTSMLGYPWMVNGFTLLAFYVFFNGAHYHYINNIESGMSQTKAFSKRVMIPAILLSIAIGVVLSFISMQSMLWALVSQFAQENMTFVTQLSVLMSISVTDAGSIMQLAGMYIIGVGVVFAVFFVLVQVFILERFALDTGAPMQMASDDMMYIDAPDIDSSGDSSFETTPDNDMTDNSSVDTTSDID